MDAEVHNEIHTPGLLTTAARLLNDQRIKRNDHYVRTWLHEHNAPTDVFAALNNIILELKPAQTLASFLLKERGMP